MKVCQVDFNRIYQLFIFCFSISHLFIPCCFAVQVISQYISPSQEKVLLEECPYDDPCCCDHPDNTGSHRGRYLKIDEQDMIAQTMAESKPSVSDYDRLQPIEMDNGS